MPVTFNIETGTGLSSSTSYISVPELTQYLLDAGLTITLTTDDQKQSVLNRMTEILDSFSEWPGSRLNDTQALEWPRENAVYTDGIEISSSIIPKEIKKALAYMVYYHNSGVDVAPVRDGAPVKSESSGISGAVSESKEYWFSGKITPEISEVKMILRRLIKPFRLSAQR